MKLTNRRIIIIGLSALVALAGFVWFASGNRANDRASSPNAGGLSPTTERAARDLKTDFSRHTIALNAIANGGPGKDGIPALSNPTFEQIRAHSNTNTTRGILVSINDDTRFYPYNILVWHEIVNDTVGGVPVAITFCPLCGTAIVYNRTLNEQVYEFKVSGLLYESNMLMYDTASESLWLQSTGEGVVGLQAGQQLTRVGFQLLELSAVKESYPDAQILTTDTGYNRDYTTYPYDDYDTSEELIFSVSVNDTRYPVKELFYIIPYEDKSIAFRIGSTHDNAFYTRAFDTQEFTVERTASEVYVRDKTNTLIPGYYEMWFSWATHNQDGTVWDEASTP